MQILSLSDHHSILHHPWPDGNAYYIYSLYSLFGFSPTLADSFIGSSNKSSKSSAELTDITPKASCIIAPRYSSSAITSYWWNPSAKVLSNDDPPAWPMYMQRTRDAFHHHERFCVERHRGNEWRQRGADEPPQLEEGMGARAFAAGIRRTKCRTTITTCKR